MSDQGGDQPQTKRRRKSGWDVQTPADAPAAQPDEELLKQQAQQALLAQQLALQKAQQIIAQQAIQKTLGGLAVSLPKPGCRVYVGSIHYDLREPDIVALFSTFGTITKSEMTMDPQTGRSKGFCFLEFAEPACAEAAMAMDGFELAGRKIKVGKPLHGQGATAAQPPAAASLLPGLGLAGLPVGLGAAPIAGLVPGLAPQAPVLGGAPLPPPYVPTPTDDVVNCVLVCNVPTAVGVQEVRELFAAFGTVVDCKELSATASTLTLPATAATAKDTKDTGRGSTGRIAGKGPGRRMVVEYADASVAQSAADSMNAFDLAGATLRVDAIPRLRMLQLASPQTMAHTFCTVLLEKMVTLEDTKDPDLKDEIAEEARNYGTLQEVLLEIDEVKGEVEVRLLYADATSAGKAYRAMNGRAFAGNKITAVLAP